MRLERARHGERIGVVIVDEVCSKHEFITNAMAIDGAGKIVGVEILTSRESYGDAAALVLSSHRLRLAFFYYAGDETLRHWNSLIHWTLGAATLLLLAAHIFPAESKASIFKAPPPIRWRRQSRSIGLTLNSTITMIL
ncbi:MAG TPA: hypothetical protein VNM15_02670 [Candidatus Binatia bacterium]|nr:hypothetical protein [Candidatus Binatia bacterium]